MSEVIGLPRDPAAAYHGPCAIRDSTGLNSAEAANAQWTWRPTYTRGYLTEPDHELPLSRPQEPASQ